MLLLSDSISLAGPYPMRQKLYMRAKKALKAYILYPSKPCLYQYQRVYHHKQQLKLRMTQTGQYHTRLDERPYPEANVHRIRRDVFLILVDEQTGVE